MRLFQKQFPFTTFFFSFLRQPNQPDKVLLGLSFWVIVVVVFLPLIVVTHDSDDSQRNTNRNNEINLILE